MGTRADFYIGRGKSAKWLGSIAYDGYPDGRAQELFKIASADSFEAAVVEFLKGRRDGTLPEHGWPWPWEDSRTTDYSYAFDDGQIWVSCFGHAWMTTAQALDPEYEDETEGKVEFPDMTDRSRITLGPRSGIMIFKV